MLYYLTGSAKHLHIKSCAYEKKIFADGEMYIRILQDVKKKDVCVISALRSSDDILETAFLVSALKRNFANIHLVLTYFGYARQDRIFQQGECLSFTIVGRLMRSPTVRVSVLDIHHESNNKKNLSFRSYSCLPLLEARFSKMKNIVVVAPYDGRVERAKQFAKDLGYDFITLEKRKLGDEVYIIVDDVEKVKGKTVVIVDDAIVTGKRIVKTAEALKKSGVKDIYGVAPHGIFVGNAKKKIAQSPLKRVYVTNTLAVKGSRKIEVITIERFIRKNFK